MEFIKIDGEWAAKRKNGDVVRFESTAERDECFAEWARIEAIFGREHKAPWEEPKAEKPRERAARVKIYGGEGN